MTPQDHANHLLAEYQRERRPCDANSCIYELIDTLNVLKFLSNSRDGAHALRTNNHKLVMALKKLHELVMINYQEQENKVIEWPIK